MKDKKNWLAEIAAAFGMNIKEFAAAMGYSRQSLYQANCGMTRLSKGRLAVAEYKLDVMNKKIMEAEIAMAEENFKKRSKLIDSLMDRLAD